MATAAAVQPEKTSVHFRDRPNPCIFYTKDSVYKKPSNDPTKQKEFNEELLQAIWPHVASFNTFLEFYIPEMVKDLDAIYVDPSDSKAYTELNPYYNPADYLKIYIRSVRVGRPTRADAEGGSDRRLWPRTCRNGHMSYCAPLFVEFVFDHAGSCKPCSLTRNCGLMPVMLRSKACHLDGLSPDEMINAGEEMNEPGGYFLLNGNERVVRYVVQQRCNHPIGIKKATFPTRELFFTEFAVLMRSAKRDGTSTTNILFMTEDRQCAFRALINRQEIVVPFWTLLRALMPQVPFEDLRHQLLIRESNNKDVHRLLEFNMLWEDFVRSESVTVDCDKYEDRHLHQLGKQVWDLVANRLRPGARYEDAARHVLSKYILVHVDSYTAKFETLLLMFAKLLGLVDGEVQAENVDSFAFQEVITPGQLYASVLKDALWNCLQKIKFAYAAELRVARNAGADPAKVVRSRDTFETILRRVVGDISHAMHYFVATGNIRTFQLDLQQLSGWTVVADRLNINRFLSHFRAVHRGQFFAQMRTTEVRKLLGETWGFLCPVHTPDGGPCGLLLHLSQHAVPVTEAPDGKARAAIKLFLHRRGISVNLTGDQLPPSPTQGRTFPLVCDGEPIARLPIKDFAFWADELRRMKQEGAEGMAPHLEVAAFEGGSGAFEGIFVFSYPGRLIRPVKHLASGKIDWIGPLGQPWMSIACSDAEVEESLKLMKQQREMLRAYTDRPDSEVAPKVSTFKDLIEGFQAEPEGKKPPRNMSSNNQTVPVEYTHVEICPSTIVSITSSLTPFSNHNQSPRNMYQCQMLKQTMGTPFLSVPLRTDNKAYRLLTPQMPAVRTEEFRHYGFDEYPTGTNAVVAVISYTGYDMEDAMILNKGSMERGFAHACVYKTKIVEAAPASARGWDARNYIFGNRTAAGQLIESKLMADGLPSIGTKLVADKPSHRTTTVDALASETTARTRGHLTTYHDDEEGYVDKINFISAPEANRDRSMRAGGPISQKVSIKIRCVRNPIVGDKFASRAGQKGILSMLYPHEDMPFTESGIVPDIVFNPHGFPSRMTVGMLIESMAGKAAAVHGKYQDCSPFVKFPRPQKTGNRWIDQGGYDGWTKRGKKYRTDEEDAAITEDSSVDFFGKELLTAGYSYYGSEPLYSGIHGMEMEAHIFIGIIYYQRLRHMVSDKWQCRSTGPIDSLTRQPVKGRKRGGGVRFGEMERDALLAHGTSALLQDRLMHCSDEHVAFVCPKCGSVLSPIIPQRGGRTAGGVRPVASCSVCKVPCRLVALPFVFRYICNELAAMGITIRLQLSEADRPLKLAHGDFDPVSSVEKLNACGRRMLDEGEIAALADQILQTDKHAKEAAALMEAVASAVPDV